MTPNAGTQTEVSSKSPVAGRSPLHWQRPSVNITPVERAGRILFGTAAVVAGAVLLAGAGSVLAGVLEVLLVAAGLDLAVTGAFGHCPLYAKLGHVPASLRRPT
jgi:hypothetical protein